MFCNSPDVRSGHIRRACARHGAQAGEVDGKTEVRYRGPNVTPGYWRSDAATRDAFDDEGYLCTGDAVKWIDEKQHPPGLAFDGRIAGDFKLSTGTFVSVARCAPRSSWRARHIQDVVLTGLNMKEVGALLFPPPPAASGLGRRRPWADVVAHPAVRQRIEAPCWTGWPARPPAAPAAWPCALLMAEPPSIDKGEITDKGSVNQRAVLKHRDALVHGPARRPPHILKPRRVSATTQDTTMQIQGQAALVTGGASASAGGHRTRTGPPGRQGGRARPQCRAGRKRWPQTLAKEFGVAPAPATSPTPPA